MKFTSSRCGMILLPFQQALRGLLLQKAGPSEPAYQTTLKTRGRISDKEEK